MKTLHEILEEIKVQHPEGFRRLEKSIHEIAESLGIKKDESITNGEHPTKPPIHS